MNHLNSQDLAPYIDHTLLKPEATEHDLEKICHEAIQLHFFGVCVNSAHVPFVTQKLQGTKVKTVSVVGFPLGAMASGPKASEADWALRAGASEIDMVLNIGWMKQKAFDRVKSDIAAVASVCRNHVLKVILETGLLTDEEKKIACQLSVEAGAHFVKTCTGFAVGKAEVADIRLMRSIVGASVGVKASGGIKTADAAWALIDAGANRLGTSSGPALVANQQAGTGY